MPRSLLFIVHGESRRDDPVPEALYEEMGEFVNENRKSGVLVDTGGLRPTAEATRIRSSHGKLSVTDDGPLSITRLSEGTGVTRQAITKHLEALGDAGLVRSARRGRERVFDLHLKRVEKAKQYLDQVAAQWSEAADRLKAFVESD